MKKMVCALNLLIMCSVFVGNYFYLTVGGIELKAACSSGFALMGIINLIYALCTKQKQKAFYVCMAIGLILAMLGDIYIGKNFILGAALFAAGHIGYFSAMCALMPVRKTDLVCIAVIFAGSAAFLLLCPLLSFPDPVMHGVCVVYGLIISLMAGKAIGNGIRKPGVVTIVMAVASVLFYFSDLMLVFDWFIGLWSWTGKACMGTYLPAQCLLAFSGFLHANET